MLVHRPSAPDLPPPPPEMAAPDIPRGAEPESAISGPVAGRYDLREQIARGGMGVVYRAQDRLLNRTAAVKVMRSRFMDRPDLLRRFMAEARINGRLQHPGVVPVYEVGTLADTRPFIAMKLIEGKTLARELRDRSGPSDNLAHYLKIFESLCQTVAYAHDHGVIHRDLKPDNVMVGKFGEVQVMDWGLAKYLNPADAVAPMPDGFEAVEKSAYLSGDGSRPGADYATQAVAVHAMGPDEAGVGCTTAGEVFGTLPYMPPEQARGETDRVDRRGDVFALGAILCQILTGQPPYFGPPETLRDQARGGKLFGAYVLLDRCGADQALVLLAKHCLAVDPAARPADAGVLATMISQCLEGVQDRARQIEMSRLAAEARLAEAEAREVLSRKARRLSRMLAVAGAMVAALILAWVGYYTNHRVVRASDEMNRRAAVLQQVEEALAEADAHGHEAKTAAGGPLVRQAAARQAIADCQRAEGLLAGVLQPPSDLGNRIEAVKADVAATEQGLELSVALDHWRGELFDSKGNVNPVAAGACHEILKDHGIDVLAAPFDSKTIRDHPAAATIRTALADWLAISTNPVERLALRTALAGAKDPPSEAWLEAVGAGDPGELARVADNAAEPPVPVASVVVVARRLIAEGKTAEAERLLTHDVRRHPTDFTTNRLLGTVLRARGESAEAVRYLTAARAARPTDLTVSLDLGLALADANRAEEALDVLRDVTRENPTAVAAHVRIGELLLAQGEANAARTRFTTAVELDPKNGPAQLGLGRVELARGDLDAAAKAFRSATASPAHAAAAHAGLGQIHLDRWEAAKAIAEFRSAVAAEPANIEYRLGLVKALRVGNDSAGALREAKAAVAVAPKSAAAHRAVGELLAVSGDRPGAVTAYKAAIQCDPADAEAHQRLAGVYERLDDRAAAAAEYKAVADLRPKDIKAQFALGRARQKIGDWSGAAEAFRRALALDPQDATAHQQLGISLAAAGNDAGIEVLKSAVEAQPDSGDARTDLGQALLRAGRFREAASTLRAAAERFPEDSRKRDDARSAARTAMRMAALEDRLPEIQSGAVTMTIPAAWAEVAEVCRRTKRFASAARFFEEAADGDPKYAGPAATCAALAGFGRGADAKDLSEAARAEWRKTALAALKKSPELAKDGALQGLREATDTLPAGEREGWKAIWDGR
jgi:eukaryotic-like serine/threonine-protein kinase